MGQYTFRIDNEDPLYKKLIKLPTAYYRLKKNDNVDIINSHIGTAEVEGCFSCKNVTKQIPVKLPGDEFLKFNEQEWRVLTL